MATATKSPRVTLHGPIFLDNATVGVKFEIVVKGYIWEAAGFIEIRTRNFTPQRVGVFGLHQFVNDNGLDLDEFVAKLQKMVKAV